MENGGGGEIGDDGMRTELQEIQMQMNAKTDEVRTLNHVFILMVPFFGSLLLCMSLQS